MILVDTSIWIDHLRAGDEHLRGLLDHGRVLSHPSVVGELALGNLNNRSVILDAVTQLPQAQIATDDEVLRFIEAHALFGLGIGYVDASLLAATRLTPGAKLWTRDKRLLTASSRLELAYLPEH
ncbi:MAG TPA: VapC toxin family PIN domain ribonuclease [Thauera sp.]|nr:VapC toxin family PIN domain ribonuclease [Thauera sp.]HHW65756.1 PIN domain-containing protein [Rhodocyclaceae bacterium]